MTKDVTAFGVHIKVKDLDASREFYEDYLGLEPIFAYGNDAFRGTFEGVDTAPDSYRGVSYGLPGGTRIEIAEGHVAVKDRAPFEETIVSPKISAMITVASLAALLERTPLRPKNPARHYYWGTIEMVLRDPDGWVIVLITDYTPEEHAAVEKYVPIETIAAPA